MELRSLPFGARPAGDSFSTRAGMEEDQACDTDPSKLLRGREGGAFREHEPRRRSQSARVLRGNL